MAKADLHNHLRTSSRHYEGDFDRTVDVALKRLGENAIVGVVNFEDDRYKDLIASRGYERVYVGENRTGVYVPGKKVLIVKGQEVPTREGHLLVLGLGCDKHLKQGRPLEDTLEDVRDNGAIAISDHPFSIEGLGPYLKRNSNLLGEIDSIEIHNGEASFGLPIGPLPLGANKKAREFYERIKKDFPHLGALSFSDGHSWYELGSSWTEIEMPELEGNFVQSLKDSIRKTNLQTPMQMKSSVIGAIDHIADLLFITRIAPWIGLAKRFETKRPE